MTELDALFETWLTRATRNLAPDAIERIRTEIGEHYEHTVASGSTPEQALAALGDPKQANRDYRRVFLTEFEAGVAARTADAKARARSSWYFLAITAVVVIPSLISKTDHWRLWIWGPVIALNVVRYLLPPSTTLRTRLYQAASVLLFPWLVWQWYTHESIRFDLPVLLTLGLLGCVLGWSQALHRRIRRKLAGRPAPAFPIRLPGEPLLTHREATLLRGLTGRQELTLRIMMIPFIALFAVSAYFIPLAVGGLIAFLVLRFVLPFLLDLSTPERSRRFLKAKVALLALAVILPPFQYFVPVPFAIPGRAFPVGPVLGIMLVPFAIYFFIERTKISIRRKLPIAKWPKELYL